MSSEGPWKPREWQIVTELSANEAKSRATRQGGAICAAF
jgi:hypothetical protein